MRVCLIYDCLYPWTVGGAERWYRALAERLAAGGDEVTYLTLPQWDRPTRPVVPGVRVAAVGPRLALHGGGRRRLLPPLLFGVAVLVHLLRHAGRYDVVHAAAFPFFPLLAAGLVCRLRRVPLVVDWWEVWSRAYWTAYAGRLGGRAGWLVQRACARLPQRPLCYSRLHAGRLAGMGSRTAPVLLRGPLPPMRATRDPDPAETRVVFAGRLLPEKGAEAVVWGVAAARRSLPSLRATIFGDGPERARLRRLVDALGLRSEIDLPGFVPRPELEAVLGRALCLVLPSRREGYGLVVLEAAALGVPSILVRRADNAATEWIVEGVNGFVAPSDSAAALASAILRAHALGTELRRSTAAWFGDLVERDGPEATLAAIRSAYRGDASAQATGPRRPGGR